MIYIDSFLNKSDKIDLVSDLFLLAFLIFFISIFVFFIKPSLLNKWFKLNFSRKKVLAVFGGLSLLTFVLFGITAPDVEPITEDNYQDIKTLEESQQPTQHTIESEVEEEKTFLVVRVIDGDTIEIEGGEKVRYIGINTPESKDPRKEVECYAKEAESKNRDLVEGKKVVLEKDISETDRYGRLLRYVYLDGVMINELLVREGYAQASSYPPDVKYQDRFNEAEKQARAEQKGLWGEVCNPSPSPTLVPTIVPRPTAIPTYVPKPTAIPTQSTPIKTTEPVLVVPQVNNSYTCDCKKTCPQMSSCEEAYYQLNVCGCSVRDGDDDGVPCETICPGG